MNYLEITGTVTGLLYLYLEYRASAWLWLVGTVMPAIYIFVYLEAGLYADLGISIYYILASIYGAWCWITGCSAKNESNKESVSISNMPRRYYLPLTALYTILLLTIGFILSKYTDSTVPWADAFTTALSIIAMWMLARKYIEQWAVWIAVDVASSVLYLYKALWFTSGLYILYALVAVFGYRKWKSMIQC